MAGTDRGPSKASPMSAERPLPAIAQKFWGTGRREPRMAGRRERASSVARGGAKIVRSADDLQILCRGLAVGAAHDLVLHALAFAQAVVSGTLDRRDVHECVGPATLRRDEPIALGGVEPLHCSGIQGDNLVSKITPGDMPDARQSNVILESGGRRQRSAASGCN